MGQTPEADTRTHCPPCRHFGAICSADPCVILCLYFIRRLPSWRAAKFATKVRFMGIGWATPIIWRRGAGIPTFSVFECWTERHTRACESVPDASAPAELPKPENLLRLPPCLRTAS